MRTSHFTRLIALAALSLGLAGTALAQEATPSSTAAPTDLSRAQVLADLEMWHRAGLTYLSDREIDVRSTEYQRGLGVTNSCAPAPPTARPWPDWRKGMRWLKTSERWGDARREILCSFPTCEHRPSLHEYPHSQRRPSGPGR